MERVLPGLPEHPLVPGAARPQGLEGEVPGVLLPEEAGQLQPHCQQHLPGHGQMNKISGFFLAFSSVNMTRERKFICVNPPFAFRLQIDEVIVDSVFSRTSCLCAIFVFPRSRSRAS